MSMDIDDVDPSIVYSGSWQASVGSMRQWGGGTIHSTTQNGASATLSFRGTRLIMYCTVLMGDGSETVNMNFDGHSSSMTRASHEDTTYYYDRWFDSGPVDDGNHTLVVSNGGGPSDTPFQIDAFHLEGSGPIMPAGTTPTPPPPPPPQTTPSHVTTTKAVPATGTPTIVGSTGSSSSGSSTTFNGISTPSLSTPSGALSTAITTNSNGDKTVVQYITTGADGSVTTSIVDAPSSALNSRSHSPTAAIVGGGVGGLLLILLLLLLLCLRRRRNAARHILLGDDAEKHLNSRPRKPTAVTPFQLNARRHSGTVVAPAHENGFTSKHELIAAQPTTQPIGSLIVEGPSQSSAYRRLSSEKSADLLCNSSPTDESMYVSFPSHDTHPPRLHEADAVPYRPRYLSGDTIIAAATDNMYTSTMLAPRDTNDFPPSYHQRSGSNSTSQPLPLVPSLH
ncbi:hypothetical protein GALMADRAFT_133934 [Galerina marginata CBS 339.88]|uniref:Uncharacterized protein n=1 Tax=Galerina marginata (strain CBS 339.88) TaxID=685588 RepID=A0A067TND2_GALM3|nr:hypothetical protein GALMADRAFT_133934 [Galerina marginata CBS 339.88]